MLLLWMSENIDLVLCMTSILAVLISFISIFLAWRTVSIQKKHNKLSVRPIATISAADYEDLISVRICNKGTGPLIITDFIAEINDSKEANDIISLMPNLPNNLYRDTLFEGIKNTVILPTEFLNLLEFKIDLQNPPEKEVIDRIRKSLSNIVITVQYKDIYNSKMPVIQKSLSWFRRNL